MKDIVSATPTLWVFLGAVAILLLLLTVSFRSRAYVFCQYLRAMTGVSLKPREVREAFRAGKQQGVRELFLDLIIREDLKGGPVAIPEDIHVEEPEPVAGNR